MVVAIIGNAYSNKSELVNGILKVKSFHADRIRPLMFRGNVPFTYPDSDRSIEQDAIFHQGDVAGTSYVTLKRQLLTNKNLVYVEDTPLALKGFSDIDIPHCVVFVDSNQSDCMHRASPSYVDAEFIRTRFKETEKSMLAFKRSGNYSFYINAELVGEAGGMQKCADQIVLAAQYWLQHRGSSEMRMPYISDKGKRVPIGTPFMDFR